LVGIRGQTHGFAIDLEAAALGGAVTQRAEHHRGFTLIEMLVALALMGLIAVILITSLQIGGHTWQRVMRAASSTEDIAQAQETLRLRLSSLYPDDRAAADMSQPSFLLSNGASLEFSGAAPDSTADGILRYQIGVSANSGALEIRSWPDKDGHLDNLSDSRAESLLSHVASMALQFWLKPDAAPGRWVDRWDSKQVPRLIRIDLAFSGSDQRRWPPLYIEPRVDTPANCVFDVVSRRCRSGA
jgi:general secretion pathway protein J